MKKWLLGLAWLWAGVAFADPLIPNSPPITPYQIGSWTPGDGSGAGLVFTNVSSNYTRIGNMIFAYAQLTYPTTANASQAIINGFPINFPVPTYGQQCRITFANDTAGTAAFMLPNGGSANVPIYSSNGSTIANSVMSSSTLTFICIYPAS